MAQHNETGTFGEEEAVAYLLKNGFHILNTNWTYGKDEVDIIALKDEYLVFVEVKTRKNNAYGEPQEFVSKAKQRHLIRAANAYVKKKGLQNEIRFDIIAVTLQPQMRLVHLQEAFYP